MKASLVCKNEEYYLIDYHLPCGFGWSQFSGDRNEYAKRGATFLSKNGGHRNNAKLDSIEQLMWALRQATGIYSRDLQDWEAQLIQTLCC